MANLGNRSADVCLMGCAMRPILRFRHIAVILCIADIRHIPDALCVTSDGICLWTYNAGSIKQSISGLDWVSGHVQKPAVVLLSLGVLDNDLSRSLDQVRRLCLHFPHAHLHSLARDNFVTQIIAYNVYPCGQDSWRIGGRS